MRAFLVLLLMLGCSTATAPAPRPAAPPAIADDDDAADEADEEDQNDEQDQVRDEDDNAEDDDADEADDDEDDDADDADADDDGDDDDVNDGDSWTSTFDVAPDEWTSTGSNPWFSLLPGDQSTFEGGGERLVITVLDEIRVVDGVETRVVEEREWDEGELQEVSRNFFALSRRTNSVYYFGEEVEIYEAGKLARREGEWLSGEQGARFGVIMPGEPLLGSRYYQEQAPGEAMDRAEVVGLAETLSTPAGVFSNCLKTEETTPLEPKSREHKLYAPGVGLVKDGGMLLVKQGKADVRAR